MHAIRSAIFAYKNAFTRTTQYTIVPEFYKSSASPRPLTTQNKDPTQAKDPRNMVDPGRVVSYDDMLKVIHQPEKVIVDVRNPEEINSTGKIPSSINIPLGNVQQVLGMSETEFKKNFNRCKPCASDEIIFYCQSGKRSCEALDKALKMGYTKSKTYIGSWNEWCSKTKQ